MKSVNFWLLTNLIKHVDEAFSSPTEWRLKLDWSRAERKPESVQFPCDLSDLAAWLNCACICMCVCVCVRWLWKRVGVTGRAISRAAFRLAMCRRWQRTNCFNCAMAFPTNQGCVKGCTLSLSLSSLHVFSTVTS